MPFLLGLLLLLTGCAVGSPAADIARAWWQRPPSRVDATAQGQGLDPRYRYLRVQVAGSVPALLVLAFEDATAQGPVEVWYSGQGETLQTLDGRLVASHGLPTDWRRVAWPDGVPSWSLLGTGPQGAPVAQYRRQRDELPSHAFNQTDRLALHARDWAQVPPAVRPNAGEAAHWADWRWFEERSLGSLTQPMPLAPALPSAWYAVGERLGTRGVVYSFQCLTQDYCLRLQPWPLGALPAPVSAPSPTGPAR